MWKVYEDINQSENNHIVYETEFLTRWHNSIKFFSFYRLPQKHLNFRELENHHISSIEIIRASVLVKFLFS